MHKLRDEHNQNQVLIVVYLYQVIKRYKHY